MAKTRFSPSPTGLMHLGNLRTALFNVLLAKSFAHQQQASTFLLRIEDTDLARSQEEFTLKLMDDLKWLDLHWQEGPFYQSQRHDIYEKYYQQLIDQKRAYWCFCSETELSIIRKTQLASGKAPRYPGTCRHLTPEQIEQKKAKGLIPALRFQTPENESIQFDDFIQGKKTFSTNDIGDFIIKKADGSASFMFCNAVDDALMHVTHVMRGEDHLTNTPRQLLILKALGLPPLQYGHMPLIIGFDGKPLSKRNGSQSVEELKRQGYFPQAIVNYLSRLGHHFDIETLCTLDELGQHFLISHIGRSPARFDETQLKHWQKEVVSRLTDDAFIEWVLNDIAEFVPQADILHFAQTIKQNVVFPSDAKEWAKQLLSDDYTLDDSKAIECLQATGLENLIAIKEAIQSEGENYPAVQSKVMANTQLKGKSLFMPIRAAVTGRTFGPELAKIFTLMGKARLLLRVERAIDMLYKDDRA
jgi:nondiscriminating glutamyl-tRNA synthetase